MNGLCRLGSMITLMASMACTSHDSEAAGDGWIWASAWNDAVVLFMTFEERSYRDYPKSLDDAELPGFAQRECQPGEHGSEWVKHCAMCRCRHGVRSCVLRSCDVVVEHPVEDPGAEQRERLRNFGLRVCEVGEHGSHWIEGDRTCSCDYGVRTCLATPARGDEQPAGELLDTRPY